MNLTVEPIGYRDGEAVAYCCTVPLGWCDHDARVTLTAGQASAMAEGLLLAACNLLRSNPRGDHHNTRAYIHDLAALAESWEAADAAEEARAIDRETARALERRDDLAADRDAAYLEAGSPHPHDR